MNSFINHSCRIVWIVWCWWGKIHSGIASLKVNVVILEILRSSKGLFNILFSTTETEPNAKILLKSMGVLNTSQSRWGKIKQNEELAWSQLQLKNESKTFWYVPLMVDNYILYFRWFSKCLIHSLVRCTLWSLNKIRDIERSSSFKFN